MQRRARGPSLSRLFCLHPPRLSKGLAGFCFAAFLLTHLPLKAPAQNAADQLDPASEISHQEGGPASKVIFGSDDRMEVYEVTDPDLLRFSEAACLAVTRADMRDNGDGTYTLFADPWVAVFEVAGPIPLCTDEPFYGQPQVGFCSAFLAGDDILVTAGHCVGDFAPAFSCGNTAFIFDFEQIDETTPAETTIPADRVYFCSEILANEWPAEDYCVLRLDRPVVGRAPMPVRREGNVGLGDPVAIVGHPRGLPKKIAGGAYVQDSAPTQTIFYATVDTMHGNSGSLVFNLDDLVIEGILSNVPQSEFNTVGGCLRANAIPDDAPASHNVKTTVFADLFPEVISPEGQLSVDRPRWNCKGALDLEVRDGSAKGEGSLIVEAEATGGDHETVALSETPNGPGIFGATIETDSSAPVPEDGTLQAVHGETIRFRYIDANDGTGLPATIDREVIVDCAPPVLSGVEVIEVGGRFATLSARSDEPVRLTARVGRPCANLDRTYQGENYSNPSSITLTHLTPKTDYFFQLEATDEAGNAIELNNGGVCFSFTTTDPVDYFTERFSEGDFDLEGRSLTFTPDGSLSFYTLEVSPATAFPTSPSGGNVLLLNDDDCTDVYLTGGKRVSLYGSETNKVSVASNGTLSFGDCDPEFIGALEDHFILPRISLLAADLVPEDDISWKQLTDRLVITYDGVGEYNRTAHNHFQAELFFDGTTRLTYLDIEASVALVGLSEGTGIKPDFEDSDLVCTGPCLEARDLFERTDFNGDGRIDALDLEVMVRQMREGEDQ